MHLELFFLQMRLWLNLVTGGGINVVRELEVGEQSSQVTRDCGMVRV